MYIDKYGKKRFKVNLHMHTSLSDGHASPAAAAQRYLSEGYDAVAFTDHWVYGKEQTLNGLTVLSGAEYNTYHGDSRKGVYHIVGIGMEYDPGLTPWETPAQDAIDAIHEAGGIAILAHPAWSLNTLEQIKGLRDIDATEIYNSVSATHKFNRPDSSLIVDMLGAQGIYFPLVAADDTHEYDYDTCISYIMVEAEDNSAASIMKGIREGKYYASQGPEVHIRREGNEIVAETSACKQITFHSNLAWSDNFRTRYGDALTEERYVISPDESFVRVEVIDGWGRRAWSQIIPIPENETIV